jgi:hypothetical protein
MNVFDKELWKIRYVKTVGITLLAPSRKKISMILYRLKGSLIASLMMGFLLESLMILVKIGKARDWN